MRPVSLVLILLVIGALGCFESSSSTTVDRSDSGASENKVAMISITSDPAVDLQEINMGLTFAGFCVDEGFDVNIFLNVKGVKLATNGFSDETKFKDYAPLKKQLIDLSKRGVQIHVCPVCMKDFGIENDEIIPDAFVTSKPKLFAKLGSDTIVFTY